MIDLVLLAVIGLSALLGLLRGFGGIVVGTASWVLAGWAAFQFGERAARWLAESAAPSITQWFGGYALVFVGVLVLVALIGLMIRAGVDAMSLSGGDRLLGFGLGLLRGALFACVLVLLMGFTPLPGEPAWRQSRLLPLLLPGADWMRAQLPTWSGADAGLGKLSNSGDNGGLDPRQAVSAMQDAMTRVLKPSAPAGESEPAQALPGNISPAQVVGGQSESDRVDSQGKARSPSQ